MRNISLQRGFSLVELSISLVIMGLIVAGIVGGATLINNAELKGILSEANELKGAIKQFELVYDGLPGDLDGETDFSWDIAGDAGATTSDGDNDGFIDVETSEEPFMAIYQLQKADLLGGEFTGLWGGGFAISAAGAVGNISESKSGRGGVSAYIKCCSGTDYARTASYNNHVTFFSIYDSNNDYRGGAVSPIEAYNIDKKVDDGIPDFGLVTGSAGWSGAAYLASTCYSGTGNLSTYDSAVVANKDEPNCQINFAYDWDF